MKLNLVCLKVKHTKSMDKFIERKLKKLDKFFNDEVICNVSIKQENSKMFSVSMRIEAKSCTYIAQEKIKGKYSLAKIYFEIDNLIDKISSQVRRDKSKLENTKKFNYSHNHKIYE